MTFYFRKLPGALSAAFMAALYAMVPAAHVRSEATVSPTVTHVESRRAVINGVELFYREAGQAKAPAIVLLHGFPSSSHMFRDLIPLLATRMHVIAPDYPGFGHSQMPPLSSFDYSFDTLATTVNALLEHLQVRRYVLYMHDYGGPVGLRIAERHPERVAGLVIQNANAYEDGLSPDVMQVLRPLWERRTPETLEPVRSFLTPESTRAQYTAGARRPQALNPDAWVFDQALLDRPGNAEIQIALLADYGSNVARYGKWQAYLRRHQPRTLIVWGKNDPFFLVQGAHAFLRDVPDARLVLLDGGHFALEEHAPVVAREILEMFMFNAAHVSR